MRWGLTYLQQSNCLVLNITAIHNFIRSRLRKHDPYYGDVSPEEEKHITVLEIGSKRDLRAAIDAKCCDCIYDPYELESWQMQVAVCDDIYCPLHNDRTRLFLVKM